MLGDVLLVKRRWEHFTWERCACGGDGRGRHFQACKLARPEGKSVEDGVALLRRVLILEQRFRESPARMSISDLTD